MSAHAVHAGAERNVCNIVVSTETPQTNTNPSQENTIFGAHASDPTAFVHVDTASNTKSFNFWIEIFQQKNIAADPPEWLQSLCALFGKFKNTIFP